MNFLKLTAAAALVAASFAASAMTAVSDDELSAVSGQDGVTIAGDLNINIGSFQYRDTDVGTGGSVNFNGISVRGMFVMTIDILQAGLTPTSSVDGVYVAGSFADGVSKSIQKYTHADGSAFTAIQAAAQLTNLVTYGAYGTGVTATPGSGSFQDVVQFAFPAASVDSRLTPSVSIASIKMGSNAVGATGFVHTDDTSPSFGSISINNMDMQGTKIWIYAH
jgi:hypothetical protein